MKVKKVIWKEAEEITRTFNRSISLKERLPKRGKNSVMSKVYSLVEEGKFKVKVAEKKGATAASSDEKNARGSQERGKKGHSKKRKGLAASKENENHRVSVIGNSKVIVTLFPDGRVEVKQK